MEEVSGWKVYRVNQRGNRWFTGHVNVGTQIYLLNHINASDNQMTFNVDSNSNQTGEVFRWFVNNTNGQGTKVLDLDASGNLVATANVTAYSDIALKDNASMGVVIAGVSFLRGYTVRRIFNRIVNKAYQ